ncbi:MAG TPA: T9SS type A sorting domain-containing protein [Bacteroidia bacterium]|nr:T9SS type A sorting domain-containing protein [Bacteroidia bacterium]
MVFIIFGNNLFDASVGIANFNKEPQLEIYPNPASSNVTLAFNFIEKHEMSIAVTDLLGRTIETISTKQYSGGETKLSIAQKIVYQPGMYIVNITIDGKVISRKISIE